jgi:hypothetical protein
VTIGRAARTRTTARFCKTSGVRRPWCLSRAPA